MTISGAYFDRQIEVFIGNELVSNFITDLRVNFDITKTNSAVSNHGTVSIYNLSDKTRGNVVPLNTNISISAGYKSLNGPQQIFQGQVLRVNTVYQFPDVITKIDAGDGITASAQSRQAISFASQVSAIEVLNACANALNIPIQEIPKDVDDQYQQGFAHTGSVKKALDTVTKRLNLQWSVQDGKLQIIKQDGVSEQPPAQVQNVTGLLESIQSVGDMTNLLIAQAQEFSPRYMFKCLINPQLIPGGSVQLNQGGINGVFKIIQVQHQGDNFDGDFVSICQVSTTGF